MGKKQYIFFDLGWTLEDETDSQIDRAKKAVRFLDQYGIKAGHERILRLQEEAAGKFAPSVFRYALSSFDLPLNTVEKAMREIRWDKSLLFLYPNVGQVLEQLKPDHFLGLIANQSPGTLKRLEKYGISGYFDLILASDEVGIEKPDPKLFAIAEEKSGAGRKDCWMIGDRLDNDIRPANQAGWKTIRVMNGYNVFQEPRSEMETPDHVVNDILDITGIIK